MQEDPLVASQAAILLEKEKTGQFYGEISRMFNETFTLHWYFIFTECPNGHKYFIGNVCPDTVLYDYYYYLILCSVEKHTTLMYAMCVRHQ